MLDDFDSADILPHKVVVCSKLHRITNCSVILRVQFQFFMSSQFIPGPVLHNSHWKCSFDTLVALRRI